VSLTPWIEEEEDLLKEKLGGLTVSDSKAPARPVKVWFRFPEMELSQVVYPFVTIDLIGIAEATERAHRGGQQRPTVQGYRPPDMVAGPAAGKTFVTEWPTAMNLDYQVTTWARNAQHDRQLLRQLWAKFPGRYGTLGGKDVPYVRPFSCQLMNMTPGHRIDEFGKRQFRNIFTLRVASELWASEIREITQLTEIEIDLPIDIAPGDWFNDITCYE
jgi:hypothetical protein